MMIGNLEGFTVEPGSRNFTLFRRTSEPRHAYEVEVTPTRIAVHQFHPVHVAHGDAAADARRYVPALRKAARQFQRRIQRLGHQTFASPSPRAATCGRTCVGPAAIAIRDDISDAFRELIERSYEREKAAVQERQQAVRAREVFENEFRRVVDEIIVPTLGEIGRLLETSGWTCKTTPMPFELGVIFEVHRGTMKAAGGTQIPDIAFSCVSERLRLGVVSYSQSGGSGCQEYALDEISHDFVAEQVLLFFRRLASEHLSAL